MQWIKDGQPLAEDVRYATRSEDSRRHFLTVYGIRPEDSGEYGVNIGDVYVPVSRIRIQEGITLGRKVMLGMNFRVNIAGS